MSMYCVYWKFTYEDVCHTMAQEFIQIEHALKKCELLRQEGDAKFICMGYENPDMVGKQGVNTIKDNVLPSGETYEWKKRRI